MSNQEELKQMLKEMIDDGASIEVHLIGLLASIATSLAAIADSKKKTGKWKKLEFGYKCSECSLCTNKKGILFYRYCPNCGAEMEVKDGEEKDTTS